MENNFSVILAKKRLKVSDVHKGTGLSKTALTNFYYERTGNPDMKTLLKIAAFLKISIDELLTPDRDV